MDESWYNFLKNSWESNQMVGREGNGQLFVLSTWKYEFGEASCVYWAKKNFSYKFWCIPHSKTKRKQW